MFIISVIGLARTSVDCFKTRVGKGSRQHDLGFDFSISSLIKLSDTSAKSVKELGQGAELMITDMSFDVW